MKCEGHRVFDFQRIGACKRPNPDDSERLLLCTIFTTAGGGTLSTAVDTIENCRFRPSFGGWPNLVAVTRLLGTVCVGGQRRYKRSHPG
jgi:hypothetical protein